MVGRSGKEEWSSALLAVEFLRLLSTPTRVLALFLILSLKPLHDCMCECSSCGLNSFPHCLQVVEIITGCVSTSDVPTILFEQNKRL